MPNKTWRILLLAGAMLTLLSALWAGLLRFGWDVPTLRPSVVAIHGPLMVSGFMGTVIGLERAVGLGRNWAYLAPACTSAGAVALLLGLPGWVGAGLMTLGSLIFCVVFGVIVRRHAALYTVTMALGAVAWAIGNLLWLAGVEISDLVAWWIGFLLLTIAGERLELSRIFKQFSRLSRGLFLGLVGLWAVGATTILFDYTTGWRIAGVALLGLAGWLLREDAARRTVRQPGLTGFIGACMLSGYVWLAAAGGMALFFGFVVGPAYDAVLHAVFLGFVMAMVFGHAPIIFPSVLGLPIHYRPLNYVPLVALHLSLVLRVGSDLAEWLPGRQWGGMLNVIAVLLFLANTALTTRSAPATEFSLN